ncbi:MAG: alpha/beta fold hydrolase [Magnetococcales bacterium]|nr:alpha/beta fold hydrolase [Magnetococcales bacterium]MBF0172071.1 alpha/beta fold hydrolase [Magnetococcales bacterium]MBF0346183.1 alpha/beta fold hydrolase [Magnetococcales bacterium]
MSEWLFWLAIGVGVGAVVYGAACLHLYLTQHRKVFLVLRKAEGTPRDWGLDYESLTIPNRDRTLHAWWIPGSKDRPVLLFCHGNGVSMPHLEQQVMFLRPLGIGIFLFDYRGYGESEGDPDEAGLCDDTEAVWRYLTHQRGLKGEDVLIYGHSLGGGVATWLAARYRCGGVILEGTFTSIPDLAADHYPWLPVRKLARIEFNNLAHIDAIQDPLLIVHSTEDTLIPYTHAERLFHRAGCPKRLLPIRGKHKDAFVQTGADGLAALGAFFRIAGA